MNKIYYYTFVISSEDEIISVTRTLVNQAATDKPFIVEKPNGSKIIGIFTDETKRVDIPGFMHHLNQFIKDIDK